MAQALRERGWRVHWLGNATGMEASLVPPQGFAFETIEFSGVRGKGPLTLALLPLRPGPAEPAFGLLVLASPDPQRFTAQMGTDFLQDIAALASAALLRLMPPR